MLTPSRVLFGLFLNLGLAVSAFAAPPCDIFVPATEKVVNVVVLVKGLASNGQTNSASINEPVAKANAAADAQTKCVQKNDEDCKVLQETMSCHSITGIGAESTCEVQAKGFVYGTHTLTLEEVELRVCEKLRACENNYLNDASVKREDLDKLHAIMDHNKCSK